MKIEKQQLGNEQKHPSYQVVKVWVIAEESFAFFLLAADKVLDVNIEAGGGDTLWALGGLFTLLKEKG